MAQFLDDQAVIEQVFDHIDNSTTDEGDIVWHEPTEHYTSQARFAAELDLLRRMPVVYCPSAALPNPGDYVARTAAGVPLVVVRGEDGVVRGFRNACRHRGMQVATPGTGCAKVFTCNYHAWTYRLDGRLEYIPHDYGFPDFNKADHGLVPVEVLETQGLVFVCQESSIDDDFKKTVPALFAPQQRVFASRESEDDVNWKLNVEATLEGYHIKPTHPETFYPYGFDNLNVVETIGRNARVTFPFRRIEKLRDVEPLNRCIDGMVTYLYHLFPNVTVGVLSDHTAMTISEPLAPGRTRFINYLLNNRNVEGEDPEQLARVQRDADFVADSGLKEDQAVVRAIQSSLMSGANTHFTYGHFEKAIVHFHRTLAAHLD